MQSKRLPKPRWIISRARWRQILADRDADRLAAAAPIQPAQHRAGDWRGYAVWMIDGVVTRIELHQAPGRGNARPRCDSLDGRVDGAVVASGGINAINRYAAQRLVPRAMSRRAVAGMQSGCAARDEAADADA